MAIKLEYYKVDPNYKKVRSFRNMITTEEGGSNG